MLLTQTGIALMAAGLALLTFRGLPPCGHLPLAAFSAAAATFDLPARQALDTDPRAARASSECHHAEQHHAADRFGGRAGDRRTRAGDARRGLGVRGERGLVPVRGRRAVDGCSTPLPQPTSASEDRGNFSVGAALEGLKFVFRAPLIARRCCWISLRRSFDRRPRCCRFCATLLRSALAATAGCMRLPPPAR